MAKVKFITGMPASLVTTNQDRKILTISDLHIGLEYELESLGFRLPSQTHQMTRTLLELLSATKPEVLVILGDIKHKIKGFSGKIKREVKSFMEAIAEKSKETIVIMGNHDGSLRKLECKGVMLYHSSGVSIDDVSFIHGNAWPHPSLFTSNILIMGHLHPTLPKQLGGHKVWVIYYIGKRLKERICKLFKINANLKKLIVHPAYNNYLGPGGLNEESFRRLSPLFRRLINPMRGYVYSLDGTLIGRFSSVSSGIEYPSF
ncbi:MAG: metallophosphoesterase [Candidatus Nezhaarchaeales archaeon]